jgi:hypothetical protein
MYYKFLEPIFSFRFFHVKKLMASLFLDLAITCSLPGMFVISVLLVFSGSVVLIVFHLSTYHSC